ncbi:hypothetical protein ACS0TY_003442 [Phlomoides rotata]
MAAFVRCTSTGNGAPSPENRNPPPVAARPLLSVWKPCWIVRTESNVRKEGRKKSHPSCVVCRGSGRVDCHSCSGRGRTNHMELTMLPKGEWPKWCRYCGGSGLGYCDRCLGTGEYRYIMGFQFIKKDSDLQDNTRSRPLGDHRQGCHTFTELLLDDNHLDMGRDS